METNLKNGSQGLRRLRLTKGLQPKDKDSVLKIPVIIVMAASGLTLPVDSFGSAENWQADADLLHKVTSRI